MYALVCKRKNKKVKVKIRDPVENYLYRLRQHYNNPDETEAESV